MKTVDWDRSVRAFLVLGLVSSCVLALACLTASPAGAALRRTTLEELTRRAETIVVATAVSQSARWAGAREEPAALRGLIVTDVRLSVCRVLKGEARDVLDVTVPGGRVGDLSLRPPDAARFRRGTTYVVFVSAAGGVLGWRQGNPAVVAGRVVGLGKTLRALQRRVGDLVGSRAVTLRPLPGSARAPLAGAASASFTTEATAGAAPAGAVPPTRIAPLQAPLDVAAAWAAQDADGALPPVPTATRAVPRQPTLVWANGFEGAGAVKPYNQPGAVWWSTIAAGRAPYNWAQTGARRDEGSLSAYCCSGAGVAAPGPYRDNMTAWMWTVDPIDLRGYTQGTLYFDYFLASQEGPDGLWVMVNTDGANSKGLFWTGDYQGFFNRGLLNLANVPGLGNVCGSASVRIAFCFVSDGAVTAEGAYVDNIRVVCGNGPAVAGITPNKAAAGTGTRVTINGWGFGGAPGAVEFFYQDEEPRISAPIASWTDTSIVCTVPIGTINDYAASAGSGPVHVIDAGGAVSNDEAFFATFSADGTLWPTSRCHLRIDPLDPAAETAVLAAADQWNNAGSPFRFVYDGRCGTAGHDRLDSHNDVFWGSLGDPSVIGCAWPFYRKGKLVECDICMNTQIIWGDGSAQTMDIQSIALHELGHWLNLRDLYGDWDAHKVMYGFCANGIVKRTPSASDIEGIRWIYGAAKRDTKRPRTVAYRSFARSGGKMRINFKIADPAPSIGWASGRIVIRDQRGRLVGRLIMRDPRVETNRLGYWIEPRCPLRKGVYRFSVYARDIEGHAQSKVGANLLIVR